MSIYFRKNFAFPAKKAYTKKKRAVLGAAATGPCHFLLERTAKRGRRSIWKTRKNVPAGSKPQYLGWLKDGVKIVKGFSPVTAYDTSEWSSLDDFESTSKGAVKEEADGQGAVTNLHSFCTGYTGSGWLIKLICGTVG